jgi:hypothetical protein
VEIEGAATMVKIDKGKENPSFVATKKLNQD